MAIGDKPNQNLFGTNYNPEDEEQKKARLAAQGAMMGANIPASAFGQAPAVAPFSMEAAGQVNPMMEQQNLESFAQPQVIFRDYDVPATPPASALSVFTPGGEVKPNVDVNAITPSPEMTSTSAVNTALNQEVAVGPTSNEPGFLYNTFVNAPVKADQIATEFMSNLGNKISTGYDDLLGSAMRNLTPAEDRKFANNEPFGKTFTDTFAITRPDGTKFYPDEVTSSAGATQAPSEASALGATPGVTSTVETPSEGAQEQGQSIQQGAPGSAQANFATRMATGEALTPQEIQDAQAFAASMGTTFDPATGYSREAFENAQTTQAQAATAPAGGLTTVGGASLSEFLSGQAMPEQGFTQAERPLGGRGVTLTPDQMNELSAEREARLDARLPGDQSVSDRDRRAARGDDISMADQTAMAKANARGATPSEVARGNQVANALGVDLATGQSLQASGGLTFEQQLSLRKQNFAEGKFDYELAKDAKTAYSEGIEASRKATTEEAQADTAGRTMLSAIGNMNDAMTRMGGRSGEFFGGGFFGKMASYLPGTSAYDQVADVEFLQSNVALNAMSELKELSSTGSTGFGALSEKELRVLTDKYANLNPFVSADLFQGNLKQLQGEFNNMLNNAWNKHSKEYSPEAANAVYGNRGGSASGATGTPSQAIPNDRNITSAADTLLSDPKYN